MISVTRQVVIEFIPELTVLNVPEKAPETYKPATPGEALKTKHGLKS